LAKEPEGMCAYLDVKYDAPHTWVCEEQFDLSLEAPSLYCPESTEDEYFGILSEKFATEMHQRS